MKLKTGQLFSFPKLLKKKKSVMSHRINNPAEAIELNWIESEAVTKENDGLDRKSHWI